MFWVQKCNEYSLKPTFYLINFKTYMTTITYTITVLKQNMIIITYITTAFRSNLYTHHKYKLYIYNSANN